MIRLEIDENNKHVLRVSASYLLALAGDISATITDEVGRDVSPKPASVAVDVASVPSVPPAQDGAKSCATASVSEAAPVSPEAWAALEAPGSTFDGSGVVPSAASVFGGDAPKPAPFTAGAEAPTTAPEDMQVATFAPAPTPEVAAPAPTHEVAAPAPTVPAAPLTPAPGVELDADGLPWDARIHSESRTKVVAGTWKYKRGVDPRLVEEVEAELRAVMGVPVPAAPAPTPPAAAPAPIPPAGPTFPSLMLKISKAVADGHTTQVAVIETVKACGLPSLPALATRPDLVASVDAAIDALLVGVAP